MKGQWQKGKVIGSGSFGNVYYATNLETGASCALKEVILIPDDPKSADRTKQLEQEIRILGQLHHPNIVQYYGSEIVGDRLCIYMEYVHPGSLRKFMQDHCRAMTEPMVRNFTRHILSGLAYLHGNKTIHRDIKGANLLVNASGIVKLADFGVSKILTGKDELSLKGSPYWMAPELMMAPMKKESNPDNIAMAVDIWSLGCTIIEMLTGKPPWSELEAQQAMFKALQRSPDIPKTLSSEGQDFLEKCFRRNPADRPTAAALLTHAFVKNLYDQLVPVHSQGSPKEPQIVTVLKIHLHCEACAQEIKRRIQKIKGVESAGPDLKNSEVTVKGVYDPGMLAKRVYKRCGKHAVIVKQEVEEKKVEEAAKEEKKGEELGEKEKEKESEGEEKKEEKGGAEGEGEAKPQEEAVAVTEETKGEEEKINEYHLYSPMESYAYYQAFPTYSYPTEIISSDENPSACSIM